MLRRSKNKKGFTLAELLIVVAIIAVLVAIAVPLFVGALDDAKENTFKANARSIKAIAVYEILSKPDAYDIGKEDKTWFATGSVDADGGITLSKIEKTGTPSEWGTWKDGSDIVVEITEVDLPASYTAGL